MIQVVQDVRDHIGDQSRQEARMASGGYQDVFKQAINNKDRWEVKPSIMSGTEVELKYLFWVVMKEGRGRRIKVKFYM